MKKIVLISFLFQVLVYLTILSQEIVWEKLYGPPGGEISVFINDNQNNILAGSAVNNTIWLIPKDEYEAKIISAGLPNSMGILGMCSDVRGNIYAALDGFMPLGVFKTEDMGASWEKTSDSWIISIAHINHDSSSSFILGVDVGGDLLRSEDEGTTWNMVYTFNNFIYTFRDSGTKLVSNNANFLYVNDQDTTFFSEDGGNTFSRLTTITNIEKVETNSIGMSYALANYKIYSSQNGKDWTECPNQNNVKVNSFTILVNDIVVISTLENGYLSGGTECNNWINIDENIPGGELVRYIRHLQSDNPSYMILGEDYPSLLFGDENSVCCSLHPIGLADNVKILGLKTSSTTIAVTDNYTHRGDEYPDGHYKFVPRKSIPKDINSIAETSTGDYFYSTPNKIYKMKFPFFDEATEVFSKNVGNITLYSDDSDKIYVSFKNQVYYSKDLGETWELKINNAIFYGLGSYGESQVFAAGGYYYQTKPKFFFSNDGGENWDFYLLDSIYINIQSFVMTSDKKMFICGDDAGAGGIIYRSVNEGQNWEPAFRCLDIVTNMAVNNDDEIFASTGRSVYYSDDGGENWERSITSSGYITSLAIDRCGYVYFGTSDCCDEDAIGEGVYRTKNVTSSVKEIGNNKVPTHYSLSQNYPNPFNPSTTISYSIPESGQVQLNVYDVLGREVAVVVNKEQAVGSYEVEFDASELNSGVYFYQLRTSSFFETKKMLLLR